jgi:hypothetical protein
VLQTGIPYFKNQNTGQKIQVHRAEEQKTKFLTLHVMKKEG